jgi:pyridoxamine 5'-phosphate oxidase
VPDEVSFDDPIARAADVFARAQRSEPGDATAVALATVDREGRPSVRMVLLRVLDHRGFVFFTNYQSRKARELAVNANGALCGHWWSIGEQIRAEGRIELASAAESDAYFATRPRESQISAWASPQSDPIESREALVARWRDVDARFAGTDVPRPHFWGGYRLIPHRIEFWRNGDHRLHDRILYVLEDGAWRVSRLAP